MNEEKEELLKVFKSIDINGDGKLTREELLAGKFTGFISFEFINFYFKLQEKSY